MHVGVIGRGLMGAAAARHLAKAGARVTLIGPDEPADKRAHAGVFASHYDEGRITRKNATHPFWSEVATASIDRYAQIEAESGVAFFSEVGAMMAGAAAGRFMQDAQKTRDRLAIESEALEGCALAARFPDFAFPEGYAALYEPDRAGHISPRRLVAAQSEAAKRNGAALRAEPVQSLKEASDGVAIRTATETFTVDRALVAAGAMTDHVLGRAPRLAVNARTIAFFHVSEREAKRLASLPALAFRWERAGDPYLLPPIRYPDGTWRLKLGGDPEDRKLTDEAEIGEWFRAGGDPDVRDFLEDGFRELTPGVAIERVSMEACVTTWTDDGFPEIGRLSERIAVATGGNGAGAKCSDELGRRGALSVMDDATENVPMSA